MNEADFISALRGLPFHPGARGLEDDCAVLEIGSEILVITHDVMAEGTHWLAEQDMGDVAWKLVAVNLSDLAAKGAKPVGVLLGHSLGEGDGTFLEGLREALETYGIPLLGGDTVKADGPRTLGLTAIGRATHTPVPDRRGAKAGDAIFVTGALGHAMLGFEALRDGTGAASEAYRRPVPLLAEGIALATNVHAMMDVSDGLLLDAYRMAEASGATFALDASAIPVADRERFDECLRWGDDYQLLFTASPQAQLPCDCHAIGSVIARAASPLVLDGEPMSEHEELGYRH